MISNRAMILAAVGVVAIAGASFYGGMQTQKSLNHTSSSQTAQGSGGAGFGGGSGGFGGGGGGGFRRGNAVFGTVQSITSSSMTVSTQSGTKTVSLTGNPTVSDGSGNQESISSIQTGDTVVAFGTPNSDGSITATRIRLNPSFGGGGGSATPQSSDGASTATPSGT